MNFTELWHYLVKSLSLEMRSDQLGLPLNSLNSIFRHWVSHVEDTSLLAPPALDTQVRRMTESNAKSGQDAGIYLAHDVIGYLQEALMVSFDCKASARSRRNLERTSGNGLKSRTSRCHFIPYQSPNNIFFGLTLIQPRELEDRPFCLLRTFRHCLKA